MEHRHDRHYADHLGEQVRRGAGTGAICAALDQSFIRIERALRPILGAGGVAALITRCLHLTLAAHPLGKAGDAQAPIDRGSFITALGHATPAVAAETGGAFFDTLWTLLASLIGLPLTEQLLRSAWPPASGGNHRPEPSSP